MLAEQPWHEGASRQCDAALATPLHDRSRLGRPAIWQARMLGGARSKHPNGRPWCGLLDASESQRIACCRALLLHAVLHGTLPSVSHQMTYAGHIPVAIAGAGPTGLTLAALLSRLHVNCVVLERASALPTHPQVSTWRLFLDSALMLLVQTLIACASRGVYTSTWCTGHTLRHSCIVRLRALARIQAHYINHRSMEVFRSMGGDLAAQIVRRSPPLDHWRSFVYCESVIGRLLGSVDHFPVRLIALFPPDAWYGCCQDLIRPTTTVRAMFVRHVA